MYALTLYLRLRHITFFEYNVFEKDFILLYYMDKAKGFSFTLLYFSTDVIILFNKKIVL